MTVSVSLAAVKLLSYSKFKMHRFSVADIPVSSVSRYSSRQRKKNLNLNVGVTVFYVRDDSFGIQRSIHSLDIFF